MDFLRNLDQGLRVALRIIQDTPDEPIGNELKKLFIDLFWHKMPVALEALQEARNAGFDATQPAFREMCFGLYAGPSNTKHSAEDVFAHLTHIAARSQKGQLRMSKHLDCCSL